jgi:hypothetical protein
MSFFGAGFGFFIVASLEVPGFGAIAEYGLWTNLELSFWSLYFGGRVSERSSDNMLAYLAI